MADDGSKTINAKVPADVYAAIKSLTGGPYEVTDAQVIRMLLREALTQRRLLGVPAPEEATSSRPSPAPSTPPTPGPKRAGGRAS